MRTQVTLSMSKQKLISGKLGSKDQHNISVTLGLGGLPAINDDGAEASTKKPRDRKKRQSKHSEDHIFAQQGAHVFLGKAAQKGNSYSVLRD